MKINKHFIKKWTYVSCLAFSPIIFVVLLSLSSYKFAPNDEEIDVPDEFFDYTTDKDNKLILNGFKESIDVSSFYRYNTIRLNENVKKIAPLAFFSMLDGYSINIKNLHLNDSLGIMF